MPPDTAPVGLPHTGILGLGLIGMAFAERLRPSGMDVVGFDVDAARGAAFSAMGGQLATSARDVFENADLILLAVFNAAQAMALIEAAPASAVRRSLLVLATTCAPPDVEKIAHLCRQKGLDLLEFPVSGTSQQVSAGNALGLAAGPRAVYDAARPVLDMLCPRNLFLSEAHGHATRTKLCINLVVLLNRAALAEGLVLATRLGLEAPPFLEALRASAAYSQVMDTKGQKMVDGDFTAQSRIEVTLKDARIIESLARDAGQWLPLTSANIDLLEHTVRHLGPDVDPSAVVQGLRTKAPPPTTTAETPTGDIA